MREFKKSHKWIALSLFVVVTGSVLGAAAQDRLSAIFNVGQGSSGSKAMVFDSGNGASNAQITSTSNTDIIAKLAGSSVLQLTSNQVLLPDGVFPSPGFGFINDTDTGFYRNGANTIGIITGGTKQIEISSSGLSVEVGGTASGANSDYVKWKVYSGSLSSGASCTSTCSSGSCGSSCPYIGGTGTTILGMVGWATYDGGSTRYPIQNGLSTACNATSDGIATSSTSSATTVSLKNCDSNSTNTYTMVIYYQ